MFAAVLKNKVIDVRNEYYKYGPDPEGNPVVCVKCPDNVKMGMIYNPDTGEFTKPLEPELSEPTIPESKTLTEQELAILDTAINTEYLVCLADIGL